MVGDGWETSGHGFDVPLKQRVRTWVFWRDLAIYFIVFSFMGHWAEMLFCYNIHLGVVMGDVDFSEKMLWHQWLFPYCAEGVAVVCTTIDFTCGMICNQNYEVWDYRALPFNFMGQVCLHPSSSMFPPRSRTPALKSTAKPLKALQRRCLSSTRLSSTKFTTSFPQ